MCINLRLLIGFLIICIISTNNIVGQIAGPNSPGTGSNVNVTGNSWSNSGNILTSNDSRASVSISTTQISDALVASNFGFSIPGTATIDGVTVSIERSGTISFGFGGITFIRDFTISLTKDSTNPVGDNKAVRIGLGQGWPTTEASLSYGGATDGWNATLTASDINSSNFGVYIRTESWNIFGSGTETGYVDHVTVTVDYTVPTPVKLISFDGQVNEEVIELKW